MGAVRRVLRSSVLWFTVSLSGGCPSMRIDDPSPELSRRDTPRPSSRSLVSPEADTAKEFEAHGRNWTIEEYDSYRKNWSIAAFDATRAKRYRKNWTIEELAATRETADSEHCFIAIFDGDCCGQGGGGVYLIDSFWYWVHPAGTFAPSRDSPLTLIPRVLHGATTALNSCGTVVTRFSELSDFHKSMHGSQLKANADLDTWYYGSKATYMGSLDCGADPCGSAGEGQTWTQEALTSTRPANSTHCFIALFLGGQCGEDGGVYQIDESWYSSHSGGTFGPSGLDSCGKIVYNFVGRTGGHASYEDSLRTHKNLGGIPAKATYVGPLDCSTVDNSGLVSFACGLPGVQWVQVFITIIVLHGGASFVTSH